MSGALLPRIATEEDYVRSARDAATYAGAIEEICRRHDLPPGRRAKYAGGSTIVFAVGDTHVVKLFEPIFARAAATERTVLRHIHGRLGVPTPELLAAGEIEGWTYLVMGQLRGGSLLEAWPALPHEERLRLCREVGRATARLHRLPLPAIPAPYDSWPAFVAGQAAGVVEHQRRKGLGEPWLARIPPFLERVSLEASRPRALLHTEIMRVHLLVEPSPAGPRLSGLFDFEPAMVGDPEYELASVGVFLTGGERGLFRAFLLGYGYAEADLTPQLQQRVMAWALLHRYSNLRWYLETIPPKRATTLEELAAEWWSFE